jgi:hypothetical protein
VKRQEVLDIVRGFFNDPKSEVEEDVLVQLLDRALPDSGIIDLMFQDMRKLTPEQIVDEAYRRQAEHGQQAEPP